MGGATAMDDGRSTAQVACLEQLPADVLLNCWRALQYDPAVRFEPVVDGVDLHAQPAALLRRGELAAGVPLLAGPRPSTSSTRCGPRRRCGSTAMDHRPPAPGSTSLTSCGASSPLLAGETRTQRKLWPRTAASATTTASEAPVATAALGMEGSARTEIVLV